MASQGSNPGPPECKAGLLMIILWCSAVTEVSQHQWIDMGFGLTIGFIECLWLITTNNYSLICTMYKSLQHTLILLSLLYLAPVTTRYYTDFSTSMLTANHQLWMLNPDSELTFSRLGCMMWWRLSRVVPQCCPVWQSLLMLLYQ